MAIQVATPLTPEEKELVRDSFAALAGNAEAMVMVFYGRLFELDPSLRSLFKIPLLEQARKLRDTLTVALDALDHFETIRPQLIELGRKHIAYGTQPFHYETVNDALLWALQQTLRDAFDEKTKGAWHNLLNAVARAMVDLCEQKGDLLDTYERAAREYVDRLGELRSKAATLQKVDYEQLRKEVERVRVRSEKARNALQSHVRQHRC
jgi:hemoglobin-like flavoprotein